MFFVSYGMRKRTGRQRALSLPNPASGSSSLDRVEKTGVCWPLRIARRPLCTTESYRPILLRWELRQTCLTSAPSAYSSCTRQAECILLQEVSYVPIQDTPQYGHSQPRAAAPGQARQRSTSAGAYSTSPCFAATPSGATPGIDSHRELHIRPVARMHDHA
jgi:hypothetical protein